jgi:hypothetical protein
MIANAGTRKPQASSRKRNDKFLSMLPEIQKQAAFAFRGLTVEAREELVQEVVATAYQLFYKLAQRGKTGLAYATPLAKFAVGHVRSGRRIGSQRNMQDVTSPCGCASNGVLIKRLDRFNRRRAEWREFLVEDRSAGPAETAVARIDWAAWLRSLSWRQRAIASALASGETTGAAARRFRLTPARISQLRTWFRQHWERFHGQESGHKSHLDGRSRGALDCAVHHDPLG